MWASASPAPAPHSNLPFHIRGTAGGWVQGIGVTNCRTGQQKQNILHVQGNPFLGLVPAQQQVNHSVQYPLVAAQQPHAATASSTTVVGRRPGWLKQQQAGRHSASKQQPSVASTLPQSAEVASQRQPGIKLTHAQSTEVLAEQAQQADAKAQHKQDLGIPPEQTHRPATLGSKSRNKKSPSAWWYGSLDPPLITKLIKQCSDFSSLQTLVAAQAPHMNYLNVSAALTHTAQLYERLERLASVQRADCQQHDRASIPAPAGGVMQQPALGQPNFSATEAAGQPSRPTPGTEGDAGGNPVFAHVYQDPVLRLLCNQLLELTAQHLHAYATRQCANTLWALAKLQACFLPLATTTSQATPASTASAPPSQPHAFGSSVPSMAPMHSSPSPLAGVSTVPALAAASATGGSASLTSKVWSVNSTLVPQEEHAFPATDTAASAATLPSNTQSQEPFAAARVEPASTTGAGSTSAQQDNTNAEKLLVVEGSLATPAASSGGSTKANSSSTLSTKLSSHTGKQRQGTRHEQLSSTTNDSLHSRAETSEHTGSEEVTHRQSQSATSLGHQQTHPNQPPTTTVPGFSQESLVHSLLEQSKSGLQKAMPQELSNMVYSLAVLQYTPPQSWLSLCCSAATEKLHQFSSQESANLLWALSKLWSDQLSNSPTAPSSSNAVSLLLQAGFTADWMHDMLDVQVKVLPRARAQELANTLNAIATMQLQPSQSWVLTWESALHSKQAELTPEEVASLAWSAARLQGLLSPCVLLLIAELVLQQYDRMQIRQLTTTLWSVATIRLQLAEASSFDEHIDLEDPGSSTQYAASQPTLPTSSAPMFACNPKQQVELHTVFKSTVTALVTRIFCSRALQRCTVFEVVQLQQALAMLQELEEPADTAVLQEAVKQLPESQAFVRASSLTPQRESQQSSANNLSGAKVFGGPVNSCSAEASAFAADVLSSNSKGHRDQVGSKPAHSKVQLDGQTGSHSSQPILHVSSAALRLERGHGGGGDVYADSTHHEHSDTSVTGKLPVSTQTAMAAYHPGSGSLHSYNNSQDSQTASASGQHRAFLEHPTSLNPAQDELGLRPSTEQPTMQPKLADPDRHGSQLEEPVQPRKLTQHLFERSLKNLQKMRSRSVANLLWTAARLQLRLPASQTAGVHQACWRLHAKWKPQELGNVIWALGRLHVQLPQRVLETMLSRVHAEAPTFKYGELCQVLHGVACMDASPSSKFLHWALTETQARLAGALDTVDTGEAVGLLYSVSRLVRTDAAAVWMLAMMDVLLDQLSSMKPAELVILIYACAKLNCNLAAAASEADQGLPLGVVRGDAYHDTVPGNRKRVKLQPGWLKVYWDVSFSSLHQLSAKEVSMLLWALPVLGLTPPTPWLHQLAQVREKQLKACSTMDVCLTVYALGRLRCAPSAAVMQELLDTIHSSSDSLNGRMILGVLQGLSDMDWPVSEAWLQHVVAHNASKLKTLTQHQLHKCYEAVSSLHPTLAASWGYEFKHLRG